MNDSLQGLRALVCGSTQGIGRATAELLAEHGAEITLFARNQAKLADVQAGLRREEVIPHLGRVEWSPSRQTALVEHEHEIESLASPQSLSDPAAESRLSAFKFHANGRRPVATADTADNPGDVGRLSQL